MSKELTEIATDWNHKYDTSSHAEPTEWRTVVDVLAVRITKGSLRGSTFDGVFELADIAEPFDINNGKLRVEVKVGWYGMRPKTTWTHITLSNEWELLRNYSGKVIHNLAK